jgi:hypothetical protein
MLNLYTFLKAKLDELEIPKWGIPLRGFASSAQREIACNDTSANQTGVRHPSYTKVIDPRHLVRHWYEGARISMVSYISWSF